MSLTETMTAAGALIFSRKRIQVSGNSVVKHELSGEYMFVLLEFLLVFCKVDYYIKLSDKNVMMQRIGNRRDLAYLFNFILDSHEKISFRISLLFCIHLPPLLKQCYYLKIAIYCYFSQLSLSLFRTLTLVFSNLSHHKQLHLTVV